jgi:quercetin dioxygenase-like cupin family protein
MPIIRPDAMKTSERLPGWHGRHCDSATMSFASYTIDAGSSIHEHHHPHEEVWIVVDGEIDVTVSGETQRIGPGCVAVVPSDAPHSVRALTQGTAIVANHPVRHDVG